MRIGSLCSGYGGLEMAVRSVLGGELAWVADNDPGAAKILAHRMPEVPNLGDITAADWNAVERVEVLTAGFPCQDVSCAGARKGLRAGNRTGVWAHVAQAIGVLRPSLVLLENVRGLLSAGADSNMERCPWCLGETGDEHALRASGAVLGDLADLGFDAEWAVVSAADAGAPHRRERIFIVAWPAADTEATDEGWRGGGRGSASRAAGWREPRHGGVRALADTERDGLEGDRAAAWADTERPAAPGFGCRSSDSGSVAEDADRTASGERWLAAPGEAEGGGPWADAGGSGGAPVAADPCGQGLEVRAVELDRHERQAAERGSGDASADTDGGRRRLDRGPGRQGRKGQQRGLRSAEREPGDIALVPCPDEPGRWHTADGCVSAAWLDAADHCPSCGCDDWYHDNGGFCAGPCGGNCVDPELGRPGGGWNSFEDDADPADVRAYALAHSSRARLGQHPREPLAEEARPLAGDEPSGDRGLRPAVQWGPYEPAIRRWEAVTGRSAPAPTEPGRTGERLSPQFVEWLMGLPAGWVTDVPGLSRNAQLKALGNGVVPQQAAMALRVLLGHTGTEMAA